MKRVDDHVDGGFDHDAAADEDDDGRIWVARGDVVGAANIGAGAVMSASVTIA